MKTLSFDIDEVIKRKRIGSELELEHALIVDKKLRLLAKDNPELKIKRSKLRSLISDYESNHWSMKSRISNQRMEESDEAERLVWHEEVFVNNRKNIMKAKLKILNLTQQEFGKILGHNSKSYMSELMNGVRPFSLRDLIVISKLLKIDLEDLVFAEISYDERGKIEEEIKKLDNPKLKLKNKEFTFG